MVAEFFGGEVLVECVALIVKNHRLVHVRLESFSKFVFVLILHVVLLCFIFQFAERLVRHDRFAEHFLVWNKPWVSPCAFVQFLEREACANEVDDKKYGVHVEFALLIIDLGLLVEYGHDYGRDRKHEDQHGGHADSDAMLRATHRSRMRVIRHPEAVVSAPHCVFTALETRVMAAF